MAGFWLRAVKGGIAMRESQCIQDYKEQGYVRQ
jgi:hypothetical protein